MAVENGNFLLKDCALIAIATGEKAHNIRELKEIIKNIHPGSIYYHFWSTQLKPQFLNREYNNDFAMWVNKSLNDSVLAEKLGIIDPADYNNLEILRQELIDVIEERIEEYDFLTWTKPTENFFFKRSHIVVFNTGQIVQKPEDMVNILPNMSLSSIFYHFIDARRRTDNSLDDFRSWLCGSEDKKYEKICKAISKLDPYFISLPVIKEKLIKIFDEFFKGGLK